MIESTPKKRNKTSPAYRCSSVPLAQFIEDNPQMTLSVIARAMGCSPGALTKWVKEKEMPTMALTALEAIKRRQGRSARPTCYVCQVIPQHREAFIAICKSLAVEQFEIKVPE